MLLYEFRIVIPYVTVEEYRRAQLYMVAKVSKKESKGGEGVEVLKNEPYQRDGEEGQYTQKIYHIGQTLPKFVRAIAPKKALMLDEEAWNAYPYCKTVLGTPFMKKLKISLTTIHKEGRGEEENVHGLSDELLKKRVVETINITVDPKDKKRYKKEEDPKFYSSEKYGIQPLKQNYFDDKEIPCMTCYKLLQVEFPYWGFQGKVENFIVNFDRELFLVTHRQLYTWMDEWKNLSMEQIRELENSTAEEVNNYVKKIHANDTEEDEIAEKDLENKAPIDDEEES